ncbi:hypothetical protein HHK36_021836 [Tetracentron sinense]|uniref:RING-type E3 ubiquitin transferase n=1 Tax=Tetracentron sinense TaxID=13715 RepID=A0A834YXQ0_TETSI|nr:hypothetical protein HHK36_021836 [Tetracentron sinense]
MTPHFSTHDGRNGNITAVAIDRDKNSHFAVKWAMDHLLLNNPHIILIHVRTRNLQPRRYPLSLFYHHYSITIIIFLDLFFFMDIAESSIPHANRELTENEVQQLFLPYRGYCAHRGVQVKDVILEHIDVSSALVDYINKNFINNIVVGASTRNALTRKFRNADVPTNLHKSAPDFCSLYVIAKEKVSVRKANPSAATSKAFVPPPRQPSQMRLPSKSPLDYSDPDPDDAIKRGSGSERMSLDRTSDYMKTPTRERPLPNARNAPNNLMRDNFDHPICRPRNSTSRNSLDDSDFSGALGRRSVENLEFAITPENGRNSISPHTSVNPYHLIYTIVRDIEAEMRRLKLELKQTMDLYSTACKEAIAAKQKALIHASSPFTDVWFQAKELHQWKMGEAQRFEEVKLAEETALAMVKKEKAKCKAAIEAAETAQKLAIMEAQRRKQAEMKATREGEERKRAVVALANNNVRYRKYSIEEIEVATNYFSASLKIGEGGYGPVYKASLDHTPVAIKILRPDAAQGKQQFQQEVEVLSCIRHPNMVLLLGACPEYGCLVYEYMDNGSLDDRLFRRGNTPPIPWRIRFRIAAEIATALRFLHQTKPEPLVHRDLKPGNILLDRNYISKISDVGLARLVPPSVADSVTQYHITSAAGTFCYIDPEYQQTGMLGTKSDIYSLGIMLLQIITAKPPMGLTHYVERAIERGTFSEMLDPMVPDWPIEEALEYAKLALRCAELRRKDRPDLGSVILPELNRLRDLGHGTSTDQASCSDTPPS